jgi:hypothetical protein
LSKSELFDGFNLSRGLDGVTRRLIDGLFFPISEYEGATPLRAFSMCMLSSDFRGVSRDVAGEAVMGDVEHCDKKEAVGFVSLLGLSSLELVSFAVCSNTSWGKKRLRRRRLFVSSATKNQPTLKLTSPRGTSILREARQFQFK